jgi:hypothetical protein
LAEPLAATSGMRPHSEAGMSTDEFDPSHFAMPAEQLTSRSHFPLGVGFKSGFDPKCDTSAGGITFLIFRLLLTPPAEAREHASRVSVLALERATCATTRKHWRPKLGELRQAAIELLPIQTWHRQPASEALPRLCHRKCKRSDRSRGECQSFSYFLELNKLLKSLISAV